MARVAKLSRFTWRDIKKENHKSYGFELIPFEQINGYTKIINKLKNNGHKSFYVFRVKNSSISRILGAREGFIFKIFFTIPKVCYITMDLNLNFFHNP